MGILTCKRIGRRQLASVPLRPGRLGLLLFLCLIVSLTPASGADAGPKRVLILYSDGRNFAPWAVIASAFQTELAEHSGLPIEFCEVSLPGPVFERGEADEPTVKYLQTLFGGRKPDLIVPFGGSAVRFALRLRQIFPSTPLLLASVQERYLKTVTLDANTATVAARLDFPGQIEHIRRILPSTTNIVVVLGSSKLEVFVKQELQREFAIFTNRLGLTWLDQYTLAQMQKEVGHLPPHTVIYCIALLADGAGVPYEYDKVIKALRATANAPMESMCESALGLGIVGGPLTDSVAEGQKSARVAVRILNGERAGDIHVPAPTVSTPIYDWRELQRWNISESRLPPGSVIKFREPTIWARYGNWMIGGVAALVIQGVLIGALVANLAKRRKAERSLRQSEEHVRESEGKFLVMANSTPVMMWVSGLDKGCTFCNQAWLEFTGRPLKEQLGSGWAESVHPQDRAGCRELCKEAFDARQPFTMEYRVRRHDGQYRWISDHGVPRYDSEQNFLGFIGSCVDVTEKKEAEGKAQRSQEELEHVSRVSILGELAGSLAHELSQPLTAVVTSAEAAQRMMDGNHRNDEELRDTLMDVVVEGRRAGGIIAGMRAMLNKAPGQMEAQDLNVAVREVLEMMHGDLVNRRVTPVLRLGSRLPPVMAQGVQLRQVLLNLVMNACDAMSDLTAGQRQLTIETRRSNGHEVEILVADNGPGFSQEILQHLFEPFHTTKPKGLGLGLAICRSIIEAHGGQLVASNKNGSGATLTLTLPAESE